MGIFFIAAESDVVLPQLNSSQVGILIAVLLSAFIALAYGGWIIFSVRKADKGSDAMQSVAKAIQEGANAYLNRQAKTMFIFVVIMTVILGFMYWNIYANLANRLTLTIGISVAFFLGVLASYGAGRMGMWLAVQGNLRVAVAALTSFKGALEIAFNAGTVSGMFTIGLGLLGATVIFLIFREDAMKVLVGFGFGGCLAALFMRVGGGIFTKAADVGADLVGKVEKSIPEDDPRNAAVIADNVGDNVGDCAGMAADVFESYEVTLVAAIILGAGAYYSFDKFGAAASSMTLALILYPLLVRAVGVFASILGTWFVKGTEDMKDPMVPITTGFLVSAGAALAGCGVVNYIFLNFTEPGAPEWWRFFAATATGVFLAVIILFLTNMYTHIDGTPVKETAASAKTGSATLILTGLAHGMQSSVWAILVIAGCVEASLLIFDGYPALQMYGVALVGLGLLTTTGYILAMDTYGPITDNANGIFEMSGALKEGGSDNKRAHEIVAKLDAIGNTTKALVKGLAIATAVIAATSLFSSFIEEAKLTATGIQVNQPGVFIGLLIGGAVPFLFSGMAINAVGRAASLVVEEVRRQFREIDGIMEGKNKPEYSKCVDICTTAAQKELIGPAILGIFTPILVGFSFGVVALGAFLAGSILTGQLMAVFMSNAGGIWDNAKKKIEEGFLGGKGSEAHKAGVVGDTVGDPLKDTAGPGLNPLIKVMNLVAILIAPVVIAPSMELRIVVIAVAFIALAVSIWMSNKSNITIEEKSA